MKKQVTQFILAIGTAIIALLAALILLAGPVAALDQCAAPGGAGGCHPTIQAAINAAGSGDTVRVVAGVYPENVVITKNLTLLGGFNDTSFTTRTPRSSIINGGQSNSVVRISNGAAVTIDGFTITGGNATANNGEGGGIFIRQATAIIRNNLVTGNIASTARGIEGRGGGIFIITSTSPVGIYNNLIQANVAHSLTLASAVAISNSLGGGITIAEAASAIITGNQVLSNVALQSNRRPLDAWAGGGGLAWWGNEMTLSDNTVQGNVANAIGGNGDGGGLGLWGKVATVTNNTIAQNTASVTGPYGGGGGIAAGYLLQRLTLNNNWVISNTAIVTAASTATPQNTWVAGGGIRVDGYNISNDSFTLNGNHIIDNVTVRRMTASGADSGGTAEGGGLHVMGISTTLILNNEVRGNVAVENLSLSGSGGWGGRPSGGGIYLVDSDTVTVNNNQILNNVGARQQVVNGVSSNSEGGGLALVNSLSVSVNANTISGNTAVITGSISSSTDDNYYPNGGGIYAGCWDRPNCNLSLVGNNILNNIAAQVVTINGSNAHGGASGGGVGTDSMSILTVTGNWVLNNTAVVTITGFNPSAKGGGIHIDGYRPNDSLTMQDNHVNGNVAARNLTASGAGSEGHAEGGGLLVRNLTTTLILSNEVRSNVAVENLSLNGDDGSNNWGGHSSGGGISLSDNDTVTISDNQISDNVAARQQSINGVSSNSEGGGLTLGNVTNATISNNLSFAMKLNRREENRCKMVITTDRRFNHAPTHRSISTDRCR
ncbi:MAG: hypothetical protein AB1801_20300, partial [Chloroflexota bacterium]